MSAAYKKQEMIKSELNETLSNRLICSKTTELSDREKINKIEHYFTQIMDTLGLNLYDDSLIGTPRRVAEMYINEIFSGLNPANKPETRLFENKYDYNRMLIEKNITLYSTCEHHFVPIIGMVHIAYIPDKYVIGLSKINRIVQFYAKRPQVQERLTIQISTGLKEVLQHNNVAVVIEANHLCIASRGIKDTSSLTHTADYSGQFEKETIKKEFLSHIYNKR